jgi:hypothetical protein
VTDLQSRWERQEVLKELLDLGGLGCSMFAAGELEGERDWLLKPEGAQTNEVHATDAQELSGGYQGRVHRD